MATDRDDLSQAIRDGMGRAREQGRACGRPSKVTNEVAAAIDRRARAGERIAKIARECGLSESTVRRYLRQRRQP